VVDGSGNGDGLLLIAEAGPQQVVELGVEVVLDGSESKGPDGANLDYRWEQTSGPNQVDLSASTTPRASFVSSVEGVYVFELLVSDGDGHSASDFAEVQVLSSASGCSCGTGTRGISWLLVLLFTFVLLRSRRKWGVFRR